MPGRVRVVETLIKRTSAQALRDRFRARGGKLTLADAPEYFRTRHWLPSRVNTPENESPCTSKTEVCGGTEERDVVGETDRDEDEPDPDEPERRACGGRYTGGLGAGAGVCLETTGDGERETEEDRLERSVREGRRDKLGAAVGRFGDAVPDDAVGSWRGPTEAR